MRKVQCVVTIAQDGSTVADVMRSTLHISGALCAKLKRRSGSIQKNGVPVYVVERVKAGDRLEIAVGDPEKSPLRPIPMPLCIVYEDEDFLILDKPKHIAVHPARDPNEATIENALAAYLGGTDNPHPVSRLDKDTTGLMTVAKSGYAHTLLKALLHTDAFQKEYRAILLGRPPQTHGMIDLPIAPLHGSTYARTTSKDGAQSLTEYEVLDSWNGMSLVKLIPHTGRTHQLRVHLAAIGCPLVGDWLYGTRSEAIDRPALHAESLRLLHPLTGEWLCFTSPIPADMQALLPAPYSR